jgi:hypothetical protein
LLRDRAETLVESLSPEEQRLLEKRGRVQIEEVKSADADLRF